MNSGDGQNSYANNSSFQRLAISSAFPVVDDALEAMFASPAGGDACSFLKTPCLRIVDFGCSSGPNTIFAIAHILSTIEDLYRKRDTNGFARDLLPEFEVFLNDVPENDFNNLFKLLPITTCNNLRELKRRGRCFWHSAPGSFYRRLFPSSTIHFAFSSLSLHWLSQVPVGVDSNNKENIYIARTTPPKVVEAYAKQFRSDLTTFLRVRAKEIVRGGPMVLITIGRRAQDHTINEDDCGSITMLAQSLLAMAVKGRVKMADLHSFNVPIYFPCAKEVEKVIRDEGSFDLHSIQGFPVAWDAFGDQETIDKYEDGKVMAKCTRAYMEPMLTSHFGNSIIMDELFERYARKAAERMSTRRIYYWNLAISVRRK